MRISDWSSDVCSSDLAWVFPAFFDKGEDRLSHLGHCGGVFGREFATRLDILGQFDGVAHTDELMPFGSRNSEHRLQKHARHDLFGKGDHEIEFGSTLKHGKASCRERMCQYV